MIKNVAILSTFILFIAVSSCSRSINSGNNDPDNKNPEENMNTNQKMAGPPVYVYKTKNDYFKKGPVTLPEDKSRIASYPDIRDVLKGGEPAYPTKLENGYLLDNRGIDQNAAFLSITYKEYAALPETPGSEELYDKILDKDPFTELYHCGSRFQYKDLISDLNKRISEGNLSDCEKLK